jgi:Uma2 family endonuclease
MSGLTHAAAPPFGGYQSLRRFSVAEYHRMIETGILDETDQVELLDGYVVLKIPRNPPHDGTIDLLRDALQACLPSGWLLRTQQAVTLPKSEPEPDLAVVRGDKRTYLSRHPGPADIGLVIEVSGSSLQRDRDEKGPIYAGAAIPIYWIVNLVDRCIEIRTVPGSVAGQPAYTQQQVFTPGMTVPLILDGVVIASLAVDELLP